jgi:tetratricopeptide (TPR) repeat protein
MELTLDQALHKAIEAHKAGQAQDADRLYTAILHAQPKHPDANHNMGVLAVGVGKVQAALPFFRTALESNQSIAQFWLSYIDALIKLDRLADAKRILEQARAKGVKGTRFDKLEQSLNVSNDTLTEAVSDSNGEEQAPPNILDTLTLDQATKLASKKSKAGAASEEAKLIYQDILARFPKNKKAKDGMKSLYGRPIGKTAKIQDLPRDQLNPLINLHTQRRFQQVLSQATRMLKQFPASATLYNILGVANADLGNFHAAIGRYKQALKIKPDYAEAYNNMGNALKKKGDLEAAIDTYKQALKIKPDFTEAYYNMGNALKEKRDLEAAIGSFKQALKIKPDHAEAYYNMGNALKEKGDLEAAIGSFKQALKIKPDYAEAYNNIGNALKKGEHEAAIDSFKQALKIKPDYAEAYNNMGAVLKKKGELEAAIDSFKQALKIKPDLTEAYNNRESILIQDIASYGVGVEQGILNNAKQSALIYEHPMYQVLRSIFNYISGDFDASEESLNQYSRLFTSGEAEKLQREDQEFCSAYSVFLRKLIERKSLTSDSNQTKIYHVGESHCLSFAHHNFNINKELSTILPVVTFGAKAYHFSNDQENAYKAITKRNLNAIPKASTVFVSFGEIDCRANEGLLQAAEKKGLKLEKLVEKTVAGYISWFENVNQGNKHKLHFFNVPAPFLNDRVANVVALFNEALEKEIRDTENLLIDVYKHTKNTEGFSNNLYHCDGLHLDSRILNIIEDQLSK